MISQEYQHFYNQKTLDESSTTLQYQDSSKKMGRDKEEQSMHSGNSSEDQIVQYLIKKNSQVTLTSSSPSKQQREFQNTTPSTKHPRFIVKDKPTMQAEITIDIKLQEPSEDYEDAKRSKLALLKQELLNENDLIDSHRDHENHLKHNDSSKDFVLNETFPVETNAESSKKNSLDSQPAPKRLQQSPQIKGARQFPKYSPLAPSQNPTNRHQERAKQQLFQKRSPRNQVPRSPRLTQQPLFQQQQQKRRECRSPNNRQQTASGNQDAQVSDKSRQIFFKKLQKQVEQAIRESDVEVKGGLTVEELKQCMFNMDYFPCMQQKLQQGNKPSKTFDFTYQNTLRNQLIQEKVFLINIWQMLNPLNQQTIDNAMVYDVLLLLIYNVQSPASVSANFLGEYLVNMYKEQKIDIESFANFSAGHDDEETMADENIQNVNKYLEFNNIWGIDKLCSEFKSIHSNKFAFVQNTQKRSRSPSPNFGGGKSPRNFDPTDNRRYKKDVIEQVTSLTFKPNLGLKTKDLDQQMTQRLLQEQASFQSRLNSGQSARRDNSADAIMKNSKQAFSEDSNSVNQQQLSSMQRYELLFMRQHLAEQRIERAKENLQNKELNECSFHPQLVSNYKSPNAFKSYQNPSQHANTLIKELNDKIEKSRRKYEMIEIQKHEKEMAECTFKPQINSLITQKRSTNQPNQVPRGYYEQINRMRKIAEEKKAKEEKEYKRTIGENYDKMKLMQAKPPSFLEKDKKSSKKKLLMYVDVNITPTKTGRIGIYEGDDIREVAKNFAKAFQLNASMHQMLVRQLDSHLTSYREKMGLQNNYSGKAPFSMLSDNNLEVPDEQDEEYEETSNNQSPSNTDIKNYMEHMASEKSSTQNQKSPVGKYMFSNQRKDIIYQ